jgi:hypothetical protein
VGGGARERSSSMRFAICFHSSFFCAYPISVNLRKDCVYLCTLAYIHVEKIRCLLQADTTLMRTGWIYELTHRGTIMRRITTLLENPYFNFHYQESNYFYYFLQKLSKTEIFIQYDSETFLSFKKRRSKSRCSRVQSLERNGSSMSDSGYYLHAYPRTYDSDEQPLAQ